VVTPEKDSEFAQRRAMRTVRAQKPAFSFQPPPAFATAEADRCVISYGKGRLRCFRMILESQDGARAMFSVASVITVEKMRLDFAQIVQRDWLTAQRAD
jgi:hypothetical protein